MQLVPATLLYFSFNRLGVEVAILLGHSFYHLYSISCWPLGSVPIDVGALPTKLLRKSGCNMIV